MKEEGGHTRKRGFPLSKQEKFKPHQPFLSPPSVFGHILASQPRLLFFGFVSLIKSQSKAVPWLFLGNQPHLSLGNQPHLSPWAGFCLRNAFALARRWFQYSHRSYFFIPVERKIVCLAGGSPKTFRIWEAIRKKKK